MNYLSVQSNFPKPHDSSKYFYGGGSSENTKMDNNNQEKSLQEIWSMNNFTNRDNNNPITLNDIKMCWMQQESGIKVEEKEEECEKIDVEEEVTVKTEEKDAKIEEKIEDNKQESPSHHARRPPNAFLIFCKKHRPIVRERFPNLENRGVTKILGEWWALLRDWEKHPYNHLAKEYKDAFLTANPNFKWYKLPAPPRRTLSTRPTTVTTPKSPINSEFNPGKLADESQLGGLTSLMNNNFCTAKDDTKTIVKPLKKRLYVGNGKDCVDDGKNNPETEEQVTKQDLMNKVVDDMFARTDKNCLRKSERLCKGKRYEMFMQEGKLLGSKRDVKAMRKIDFDVNNFNNNNIEVKKPETPKLDLSYTIKRLAERTNVKIDLEDGNNNNNKEEMQLKRTRSVSECKNSNTDFNLDLKISNLPCLLYDDFLQRKREGKKRKIRVKSEGEKSCKVAKEETQLVGSKKRKNKHSITHMKLKQENEGLNGDLIGLATLAEVAANTEKINEISEF